MLAGGMVWEQFQDIWAWNCGAVKHSTDIEDMYKVAFFRLLFRRTVFTWMNVAKYGIGQSAWTVRNIHWMPLERFLDALSAAQNGGH
jgi:hypothetical protein